MYNKDFNNNDNVYIPLTIEKQLENYANHKNHTERHEILWHTWKQNQSALKQLLEYASHNFQPYSRHDSSHSDSVILNIERILGEEQIKKLSPTDCFCLLHVAYIHDIGMCLTNYEREKLFETEQFSEFTYEIENGNDSELKKAVQNLKRVKYSEHISDSDYSKLYKEKLKDYNSMVLIISEYQRKHHGEMSKMMADGWEKSNHFLNTMCIPDRIYKRTAHCAKLHVDWNFDHILKELEHKEDGFVNDVYHPRFIAVMLQLGDLLDLDNNRFNPFVLDMVNPIPKNSKIHYNKHKSIVGLHISNNHIFIEADCPSIFELRQLRIECDWLKDLLQVASYHWAAIVPNNISCKLPSLSRVHLMLNGKNIPSSLVTSKFEISQSKAFGLLQGTNIYESKYVFIRELLQNASDASKMQYWEEVGPFVRETKNGFDSSHIKIKDTTNQKKLSAFPIKIILELGMQLGNEFYPIHNYQDCDDLSGNVGLRISVQDYGTGISEKDLNLISKVGTSKDEKRKLIESMPEWLQPSGCFGIGLQSLFNINNYFKCITRTRSGEAYDIDFNSGTQNGMINVTTIPDKEAVKIPYGSKVSIFVSDVNKTSHSYNMDGWSGMDPLDSDYVRLRHVRRSYEMLIQFIYYVNSILGESLFPIEIQVEEFEINDKIFFNSNTLETLKNINKLNVSISGSSKRINHQCNIFDSDCNIDTNDYSYKFIEENGNLIIWSSELNTVIEVDGKSFLSQEIGENKKNIKVPSVCVRYKGLIVENLPQRSMISGIDIKAMLDRKYLELNRSSFTTKGKDYIIDELLPKCEKIIEKVLSDINTKAVKTALENKSEFIKFFNNTFFYKIDSNNVFLYNNFTEALYSVPLYEFSKIYLDETIQKLEKSIQTNSNDNIENPSLNLFLYKFKEEKLLTDEQINIYLYNSKINNKVQNNQLYEIIMQFCKENGKSISNFNFESLRRKIKPDFVYNIVTLFINNAYDIAISINKSNKKINNKSFESISELNNWIFQISLIGMLARKGFSEKSKANCLTVSVDKSICFFDIALQQLGCACSLFMNLYGNIFKFPNFFNVAIYEAETNGWFGASLPTILCSDMTIGIYSERHAEKMQWFNFLASIDSNKVSILAKSNNILFNSKKWIELESYLESQAKACSLSTREDIHTSKSLISDLSQFLLRSLPTVALAEYSNDAYSYRSSTEFTNNRLNILAYYVPTSVFETKRIKKSVSKKILKYLNNQTELVPPRLRTMVSYGYENLILHHPTTNLIEVKKGYVSQIRKTILIPFCLESKEEVPIIKKILEPPKLKSEEDIEKLNIYNDDNEVLYFELNHLLKNVNFINNLFNKMIAGVAKGVSENEQSKENLSNPLALNFAEFAVAKTIVDILETFSRLVEDNCTPNNEIPEESIMDEFGEYVVKWAIFRNNEETYNKEYKNLFVDIENLSKYQIVIRWIQSYFKSKNELILTYLDEYLKKYLINTFTSCKDFELMLKYVFDNAEHKEVNIECLRQLYEKWIYEYALPMWKDSALEFDYFLKSKENYSVKVFRQIRQNYNK